MSFAKTIRGIEPNNLEWLSIEDDAGRVWRYRRVAATDLAEPAHVEGHLVQGQPFWAALIRDADGHALLHQDGAGLPKTMVVEFIEDPSNLYLTSLGLPGKAEYVLVA